MVTPDLSIIVPAYNEARGLPTTLAAIDRARRACGCETELLVVDNASTDATSDVARTAGAGVVAEPVRSVARARNTGAAVTSGAVLVFVDADTWVPADTFERISRAMEDPHCVGGAVDVVHRPRSRLVAAYLVGWRLLGRALRMSQGATHFCRRSVFEALGGYDERQWMGEDVEFQWRLRALARRTGSVHRMIRECRVVPSPRRFDQWPLWRTFIWTHPLTTAAFARSRRFWRKGWYEAPPR